MHRLVSILIAFALLALPAAATSISTTGAGKPTAAVATIDYVTNAASSANLTTYTFSSQSFGAADATRKIIVGVIGFANPLPNVSTVTIGGVSASIVANGTGTFTRSFFAIADVPTGTTGDVGVTYTGGALGTGIGIWRTTNLSSSTADDTLTVGSGSAGAWTGTIDVPANGVMTGISSNIDSLTFTAWTPAGTDFSTTIEAAQIQMAGTHQYYATVQTGLTVTAQWASGTRGAMSAASWD